MAVGGKEDNKIHLYAVQADGSLVEEGEIAGHRGSLTSLAFSPDGVRLAAGDLEDAAAVRPPWWARMGCFC